jgi:hydrogenase maturation protease
VTTPRVLVAGIGNVFLGDDGFGVEVVRRLAARGMPDGVRVMDAGIRGFDLAYALLDDYAAAILIDVTPRGGPPGTVYVLEPEIAERPDARGGTLDTHGMVPDKVLALVHALGGTPPRLYVVGCEPESFGSDDDVAVGLSAPVAAAIEGAVAAVDSLIATMHRRVPSDA